MTQESITLAPITHASGHVRVPGSKSITNRALLLAALGSGETTLVDPLRADDTERMKDALDALGVSVVDHGETINVVGCGGDFPNRDADIYVGNAGTVARTLSAVLAFADGSFRLDGNERMRERPIGDLVDSLRALGAHIEYLGNDGSLPLAISPAKLTRSEVTIHGTISSQFITALLLAAPRIAPKEGLRIRLEGPLISRPYVDMTVAMMTRFGALVTQEANGWRVMPGRYVAPSRYAIEGDASSASYFLALGVLAGGPVRVDGVGDDSLQGDARFIDALERMGAVVERGPNFLAASAPDDGMLKGIEIDCTEIPDAAMTLVPMALKTLGPMKLTGIGSWRVKETDRIAAMATEMSKFGAEITEGPDFLEVELPARDVLRTEVTVDTYDDHRIAMSLSLAAACGVQVTINDPQCTRKTFPDYFEKLASVSTSEALNKNE